MNSEEREVARLSRHLAGRAGVVSAFIGAFIARPDGQPPTASDDELSRFGVHVVRLLAAIQGEQRCREREEDPDSPTGDQRRDERRRVDLAERGLRGPDDWACDCYLGDEPGAPRDWQTEDFPDIKVGELLLLADDVYDTCCAGPDPVDKLAKAVRAYFSQNPY
jgi:hypothetical protein